VLSQIMAAEDFGPLAIDADEGLCLLHSDTGWLEPFERLSLGQQVRAVFLGVGVKRYPGKVMPLDPAYWYALQPAAQRDLVTAAVEMGIMLISEMPTDELGIVMVHLGAEWVASGTTAEQWALSHRGEVN
jgi:hypothetical protein